MSAATRLGRKMRAFSLAEMLIVIGIIAILIALLLPTVTKIRQQAQTTQCMSNLGQIYKAELLWKADNSRDKINSSFTAAGWMGTLMPYLASVDVNSGNVLPQVYFCPGDLRPLTSAGNAGTGGTSGTGGTGTGTGGSGTGGTGSTNNLHPQNLFVRWYSDSYGTYDVPLAVGPRVQARNVTPTSYELWMEQEPASVTDNLDFNDLVVTFKDNGDGTTTITLSPQGDGSHHAAQGSALVNKGTTPETVVWDHMYRAGGTQPGTSVKADGSLPSVTDLGTGNTGGTGGSTGDSSSKTIAHYGLNNAMDSIMGKGDKVLGMDYLVDLVDSKIDNWTGTTWVDQTNILRFARHNKKVNVLFADGSVKTVPMYPNDKQWDPYYTWIPWLPSANWIPAQ